MKSETLQLSGSLDEAAATQMAQALNAVNGVAKIAIATAAASVYVVFNEDMTSTQELRAVLQRAGFRLNRPAHGEEGMCCGSCGS